MAKKSIIYSTLFSLLFGACNPPINIHGATNFIYLYNDTAIAEMLSGKNIILGSTYVIPGSKVNNIFYLPVQH